MRTHWWVAGMIALSACDWGEPRPGPGPGEVALRVGQSAPVVGVIVGLSAVLQDSRCPVDVVCVSTGNAVAEVSVGPGAGHGPTYRLVLNTTEEPREGTVLGMRVRLVDLQPAPVSTRDIEPGDYVVRLEVEPVTDPLLR